MFSGQRRKNKVTKKKADKLNADEIVDAIQDPQIQVRKCVEYLPCRFTQEEIIEMSQEQARTYQDLIELEDRKKQIMADLTADIKKKEATMGALSRKINSGYEHRNVACEWILNFRDNKKTLVRLDMQIEELAFIVREMPLSDTDRQASLELAEKGKDEPAESRTEETAGPAPA